VQVKLLRAIQERQIRRVGETRDVKVDVRLIAASNRDVTRAVADGLLREDLFYRLNVIPIHLPPLRERKEDIPLLVVHFIEKIARATGKAVRGIAPDALALLESSPWPGNIRELENVIERAIVLGNGDMITREALPATLGRPRETPESMPEFPDEGFDLESTLDRLERRYIQQALQRTGGNQTRAAGLLGLSFRQLRYKVRKHGLQGDPGTAAHDKAGSAISEP
jgi:DNA-binding NtrC family response regulator